MTGYAVVGGTAAVVTFLATFVMRWLAPRIGAMAMPGARSVHTYPTPVLGGAAMFIGLLAAMGVASQLQQFHEMFDGSSEPIGILLAAGVMFLVGGIDDMREVSPPAKVAGQVFSGSVLSLFGVTMLYFRVPFASYQYIVLSPDLAALVTVLAVVFLANAMNLIDGLDGLATGIALIAGLALFLYADRLFKAGLIEGSNIGPLVAIIIVGMCAGFLPHNFNPARIFMGDAGAMLLGLLLAVTTITIGGRTADQFSGQTYFFFAPLVIPVLILAVPLLDTAFSFLRRLVHGQSISMADREHLHHRLMRLGHGPRRSVVILWLWTALLSATALIPTYTNRGNALVPLALAALALLLFTYFHPGVRIRREAGAAGTPDGPVESPADPAGTPAGVVDLQERRRRGA
jgi:UDP-GlcNAc:undecaprenyl-phosphate/decaprenyl-phosphate GlcNAc-1-phosphate transferase